MGKFISEITIKEYFQNNTRKVFSKIYYLEQVALDKEYAECGDAGLDSSDKELKKNCSRGGFSDRVEISKAYAISPLRGVNLKKGTYSTNIC